MQYWRLSWCITLTFFRTDDKHVLVWCGFACLGWRKLTLTPSGIPKKFLVGLKRTWNQKLSPGLMSLTFVNALSDSEFILPTSVPEVLGNFNIFCVTVDWRTLRSMCCLRWLRLEICSSSFPFSTSATSSSRRLYKKDMENPRHSAANEGEDTYDVFIPSTGYEPKAHDFDELYDSSVPLLLQDPFRGRRTWMT